MCAGLISRRVICVKRSVMERLTLAQFFPLSWRRSQPLWGVCAGESEPFEVRSAGIQEASSVRCNECPYAKFHGMSLSAGGFASDERKKQDDREGADARNGSDGNKQYSMLMEMQWIQDPTANVENWGLTDIEKILEEAFQLNPHASKESHLPGEMYLNVGQNPKIGSSIKQTQHTQICEGALSNYPVLQLSGTSGPKFSTKLNAEIDLVDIGSEVIPPDQRGFFLKVRTARPTAPTIVEFLVDLRLMLLKALGGGESIDFMVTAMSDERGEFVILFAPIPQLEKLDDAHPDMSVYANPLTGESSESAGLEESRIDFGKGVGWFLVAKPALRAQLLEGAEDVMRRLWAFNRVPGARELVEAFVRDREIFAS